MRPLRFPEAGAQANAEFILHVHFLLFSVTFCLKTVSAYV